MRSLPPPSRPPPLRLRPLDDGPSLLLPPGGLRSRRPRAAPARGRAASRPCVAARSRKAGFGFDASDETFSGHRPSAIAARRRARALPMGPVSRGGRPRPWRKVLGLVGGSQEGSRPGTLRRTRRVGHRSKGQTTDVARIAWGTVAPIVGVSQDHSPASCPRGGGRRYSKAGREQSPSESPRCEGLCSRPYRISDRGTDDPEAKGRDQHRGRDGDPGPLSAMLEVRLRVSQRTLGGSEHVRRDDRASAEGTLSRMWLGQSVRASGLLL
jgi:hypothetical protein